MDDRKVYKKQGECSFIPIGIKKDHLQEIEENEDDNRHNNNDGSNRQMNNNDDEWGKYVEYQ